MSQGRGTFQPSTPAVARDPRRGAAPRERRARHPHDRHSGVGARRRAEGRPRQAAVPNHAGGAPARRRVVRAARDPGGGEAQEGNGRRPRRNSAPPRTDSRGEQGPEGARAPRDRSLATGTRAPAGPPAPRTVGGRPRRERHEGKGRREGGTAPREGKPLKGEAQERYRDGTSPEGAGRSKPARGCETLEPERSREVGAPAAVDSSR